MINYKLIVGSNLNQLRKQQNKSQAEVAKYLELTVAAYQNYEAGRREANYETLVKLADFYGVTTDYILGREPVLNSLTANPEEEDEDSIIEKFMSLPDSFRACVLELLRELVVTIKGSNSMQSTAQEQIKKTDTYNSEFAVARSSERDFLNVPDEETEKTFTRIEPDPDF